MAEFNEIFAGDAAPRDNGRPVFVFFWQLKVALSIIGDNGALTRLSAHHFHQPL